MVRHTFLHASHKKESHKCQFCTKAFGTTSRLNDHIKKEHQNEVKVTQYVSSPITWSLPIVSSHSDFISAPTLLMQNITVDSNGQKIAQPIFSTLSGIPTTNMAFIGSIITSQNQLIVQSMPNETPSKAIEIVDLEDECSSKEKGKTDVQIDRNEDKAQSQDDQSDDEFQCKKCSRSFKYASIYNVHLKHCY